jgi:hypothetical protein
MIFSARYPTNFTERKKAEAITDNRIFVRDYAAWATRPFSSYLPGRFRVEIRDTTKHSPLLTVEETNVNLQLVLAVATDFKDSFDKSGGSIRDYAGISTLAVTPYIASGFSLHDVPGCSATWSELALHQREPLQDTDGQLVAENLPWIDYPK